VRSSWTGHSSLLQLDKTITVQQASLRVKGEETEISAGSGADLTAFLGAMAAFPTGVTVVTTADPDGKPYGLTCNAFTSLSADPPLVLVSVDERSNTLPALQRARRFVVNFLAAGRGELARTFASKSSHKFREIAWTRAANGLPVLRDDSIAHVVCELVEEIPAGDHVILIGRVHEAQPASARGVPLLYYRRTFDQWPVFEPGDEDLAGLDVAHPPW
jgi:flavin reductase (DIM6/NTAB) family NADH-FMN oxidoreductase RutF